jgi:hypothetical protein
MLPSGTRRRGSAEPWQLGIAQMASGPKARVRRLVLSYTHNRGDVLMSEQVSVPVRFLGLGELRKGVGVRLQVDGIRGVRMAVNG